MTTVPMFREGELVEDKHGNIFKILKADDINDSDTRMHYNLELVTRARNSLDCAIGAHLKFKQPGDSFWVYDTEEAAKDDQVKVTDNHLFATELKLYEADKVEEIAIPMFDRGDYVKDKFGNIFKIIAVLAPQYFERDSFEYDEMGYQLELIEKAPNTRAREVGDDAVFHREGDEYWIYNTEADIRDEGYEVTPETIFATELVLFEKSEEAVESEEIEEADVPIFLPGDLVKDAFGNTFEVYEAKPSQRLDPDRFDYDNMGYRLKLVTKNPQSPVREVHDNVKFVEEGSKFWVYNREEDARAVKEYNPYTITASELVMVRSVLQTKPAKPANSAKAELARRYPSIEDLQKMSEENDLGNLLDQAYTILKEQASLGERNANLQFETFKRCIPHFEQEGYDITEHGMLIEVRW